MSATDVTDISETDGVTPTESRHTFAAFSGTQAHGFSEPHGSTATTASDVSSSDELQFTWNRFNGNSSDQNANKQVRAR